jgi:phospholipid/cholesterol/gamma-HCH transport system permease protein
LHVDGMPMTGPRSAPATLERRPDGGWVLAGPWTAIGLGTLAHRLDPASRASPLSPSPPVQVEASGIDALDTAGAWVLQGLLARSPGEGGMAGLRGLKPEFERLMTLVGEQRSAQLALPPQPPAAAPSLLARVGAATLTRAADLLAALAFCGATARAMGQWLRHPRRIRVRPILFNIQGTGVGALPIVGLLSFLLGVVVSYQSANQLRQYGANIFIVDIVGISMLREFAPLIAAIIIAGRSGASFAAQIGTMAVTEEIDAMRTLGIAPLEMLVLPKLVALVVALPLLTVFADVLGVFGGMVMASAKLDVGFTVFLDRFVNAVEPSTALVGIGKAAVFAAVIVLVGCFQGFRTHGGADSVGRQTTRSVVGSIFLVIVVDAMFSIAFSALGL